MKNDETNETMIIRDSVADWVKFFRKHPECLYILRREIDFSPYIKISLSDISRWSLDYYIELTDNPRKVLGDIRDAAKSIVMPEVPAEKIPDIPVYLVGSIRPIEIKDIRSKNLNQLLSVEGMVKKITEVKPTLIRAAFRCPICNSLHMVTQQTRKITYPKHCVGQCRSQKFDLVKSVSEYQDTQRILIQETPEGTDRQGQPQDIEVYMTSHLAGRLYPGQRLTLNGILCAEEEGTTQSTALHKYIQALGYDLSDEDYTSIDISEEEETKILEVSKRKDLSELLIRSITPSIYGYDHIKEGLLLQSFGGVAKVSQDGHRLRGDIHILLVGDPGIAKSDFLRVMYESSPLAIITSGKSSTTSGLTATAVKDEFGQGKWSLEAGALVMADGGIACIDEIGQIDPKELSALHEAMEQQRISIAKAGMLASLWCRCGILAAANPSKGRFDFYTPIPDQIKLPPPILSRFDLIFVIQDLPQEEQDARIADHILGCHMGVKSQEEVLERSFVTKYIAYSRRNIIPKLTPPAAEIAKKYYMSVRSQSAKKADSPVATTPRQLQAIVRLAEATARMRLSNEISEEDVKKACRISDISLRDVAYDKNSQTYDVDMVATGISYTSKQIMRVLQDIIKDICRNSSDGNATRREVFEEAERQKIDRGIAEKNLERLIKEQEIFEPRTGLVRSL